MISSKLKRLGCAFLTLKLLIIDATVRKALVENVRNCIVGVAVLAVAGTYIKLHQFIKEPDDIEWLTMAMIASLICLSALLLISNVAHFFSDIWKPMHAHFCEFYCDNFKREEQPFFTWSTGRPHSFTAVTLLLLLIINSTVILFPAKLIYDHLLESSEKEKSKPLHDSRLHTIFDAACATQALQTGNCADDPFPRGISETQTFLCAKSVRLSLTQNIFPQYRPSILLSWDKNNIHLLPSQKLSGSHVANKENLTWSETSMGWTLAHKDLPDPILTTCIKQP